MTTVAVIEDDPAYRAGVERLLVDSGRFALAGAYGSAEEALRVLTRRPSDIALCDINLPGLSGSAAVARLRQSCPALRCVMLTTFDDAENLFTALQAGAAGYLLKSLPPEDILDGLDELLAGGAPMSRAIARRVLASFARPATPPVPLSDLTTRERETMDQLARGLAYKEIATVLGVSTATVKNHLYHIYQKMAVRSGTEAVAKWMRS